MNKISASYHDRSSIMKLLDISPFMRNQLMEYGDIGENAFDVYTLYKSAAKRHLSDTIKTNDALDMQCLAWMTKEEFFQARRLLKRLGFITESIDQEQGKGYEIRHVRLERRVTRGQ